MYTETYVILESVRRKVQWWLAPLQFFVSSFRLREKNRWNLALVVISGAGYEYRMYFVVNSFLWDYEKYTVVMVFHSIF